MKRNFNNDGKSTSNLFDKITKRYSGLGSRIIRKSPGRKNVHQTLSDSYDMTGHRSDDFRPEIGAPILISKTTKFDFDSIDNLNNTAPSTAPTSADSENDTFFDANSSLQNFSDIKFSFLSDDNKENSIEKKVRLRKNRSKSAQNLHKAEMKVFLEKAPSLNFKGDQNVNHNNNNIESLYDFPKTIAPQNNIDKRSTEAISLNQPNVILSEINISLVSSDHGHEPIDHNSFEKFECDNSFRSNSTQEEDFDLKSASFQSLDAKNLFISIDELNEITRQINDSDIFKEINLEYIEHRNNLMPREKRLTLLKNKSNRSLLSLDDKKVKLSKKWTGFKNWIGEEHGKIREVVQKHAAMQRVGASITEAPPSVRKANESELESNENSDVNSSERTVASEERGDEISVLAQPSQNKQKYNDFLEGQNGFEEIRRYVKQGGDFGKDLIAILQERTETEQIYAKSLSKIASKLNKACRDLPGTIAESWRSVSTEIESRSEIHRQFSNSLAEEIVKPLKTVLDNQHKARKAIENSVDKSGRILAEWRNAEIKAKKSSHSAARENEKLQDAMLDVRIQRSPSISILTTSHKSQEKESKSSEKDSSKLENKRKKAEDAVKKADVEYYTLCIRAERARVDWEMSVLRGSSMLQSLENQRLSNFKNYVSTYLKLSGDMNPLLGRIVERLNPQVNLCNIQKDLDVLKNIRRAAEGPSEQLLPDFYCEHTTLAMNRERRKQALVKLLQLIRQDLDRERRSRNSLKGYSQTFDNAEGNQNIADKLYHIRSMLTYLEGARYKLQSALFELDHKPRTSHPLAQHIQITRDRTGLQQSVLKVPLWLKNEDDDASQCPIARLSSTPEGETCVDSKNDTLIKHLNQKLSRSKSNVDEDIYNKAGKSGTLSVANGHSPTWDRGIADGVSNQPDSDFDEFSSQDEEEEKLKKNQDKKESVAIGRCRALFSYTPKLYDELELEPGDIIDIHIKQDDGWWLGALKEQIGIFPATYVEEIQN